MCDCARRGWVPSPSKRQTPASRGMGGGATAVWGPKVWGVLHDLAEVRGGGAEVEMRLWEELGRVLPGSLPCAECQGHMTAWFAAHPLGTVVGPRVWILAAHNAVNERLGRRVWTEAELTEAYRGCDLLMLELEAREMVRELGESGMLGAAAIRVMERMLV
jgi:hypothetical protein